MSGGWVGGYEAGKGELGVCLWYRLKFGWCANCGNSHRDEGYRNCGWAGDNDLGIKGGGGCDLKRGRCGAFRLVGFLAVFNHG